MRWSRQIVPIHCTLYFSLSHSIINFLMNHLFLHKLIRIFMRSFPFLLITHLGCSWGPCTTFSAPRAPGQTSSPVSRVSHKTLIRVSLHIQLTNAQNIIYSLLIQLIKTTSTYSSDTFSLTHLPAYSGSWQTRTPQSYSSSCLVSRAPSSCSALTLTLCLEWHNFKVVRHVRTKNIYSISSQVNRF